MSYTHNNPLTIQSYGPMVTGSSTTPVSSSGTDFVFRCHLTGATAAHIYSNLVDTTNFTDFAVFYLGTQIDVDIDQQSFGAWSANNICFHFKAQANQPPQHLDSTSYSIAYGNASPTIKQNWDNIYPFWDAFYAFPGFTPPSTINTSKWTASPAPGTLTISGGVLTYANGGGNFINTNTAFGAGYVTEVAETLPVVSGSGTNNGSTTNLIYQRLYNSNNFPNDIIGTNPFGQTFRMVIQQTGGGSTTVNLGPDDHNPHLISFANDSNGVAYGGIDGGITPVTSTSYVDASPSKFYLFSVGAGTIEVSFVKVRPFTPSEPVVQVYIPGVTSEVQFIPTAYYVNGSLTGTEAHATDNNFSTVWSAGENYPVWLGFDLGTAAQVTRWRFCPDSTSWAKMNLIYGAQLQGNSVQQTSSNAYLNAQDVIPTFQGEMTGNTAITGTLSATGGANGFGLLTVTELPTGVTLSTGIPISGTGIPAGTFIASFGTGIGGTGIYNLSAVVTTEGSQSMTVQLPSPDQYPHYDWEKYNERLVYGAAYRYWRMYFPSASAYNPVSSTYATLAELALIGPPTAGVNSMPVAPHISPWGGGFTEGQTQVALTTLTSTASIYYTTDGSTPTNGGGTSTLYTGPFTLSTASNPTLKAIAYDSGQSTPTSLVSSATFSANVFTPGQIMRDTNGDQAWICNVVPNLDPNSGRWLFPGLASDSHDSITAGQPDGYAGGWIYSAVNTNDGFTQWRREGCIPATARPGLFWNATTGLYVLIAGDGGGPNFFTSPYLSGPYELVNSQNGWTNANDAANNGDVGYCFDSAGNLYAIYNQKVSPFSHIITQLAPNFCSTLNMGTYASIGIGSSSYRECPMLFERNGVWFAISGLLNGYDSALEMAYEYLVMDGGSPSANPLGTWPNWSAGTSIFASDPLGTPYNCQFNRILQNPSVESGFVIVGDYWNNSDFSESYVVFLPLTFPTNTTLQVEVPGSPAGTWNWNFFASLPTNEVFGRGRPAGIASRKGRR